MEKYFLDKRILVNGRKSHIYLDNFIDLSEYIVDVITALQPYTFQNGLTESPALTVELGGSLLRNTTINGNTNTYDLLLLSLETFAATGNTILLQGTTDIRIQTPLFLAKQIGSVLQLVDLPEGKVEYSGYGLPTADGAVNQVLTTNGAGLVSWQAVPTTLLGAANGTSIVGNNVYLGGPLLMDTTVSGVSNAYDLRFTLMKSFQAKGLTNIIEGSTELRINTPNVVATTAQVGQILQLTSTTGIVEYASHKCQVLYFTDNPLNTTYNVNGAGNITIDSYILPGNTLTSDGSYIELEVGIDVSGTIGTNPVMYINVDGKAITSTHAGAETSYYQLIKTRCTRVSSTTFLTTQLHTINDSISGLTLASYSKYDDTNTLISNFTDQVNIDILFPQNLLSDQVVQLKHFTITKYLK